MTIPATTPTTSPLMDNAFNIAFEITSDIAYDITADITIVRHRLRHHHHRLRHQHHLDISNMGALVCADGRYYHEWSLNTNVATVNSAVTRGHNVRTAPSKKADIVGMLTDGDVVEVVGEQGDWLQITHRHGEHNTAWTLMQAAGTFYLSRAHKFASTAPDIPDQDEAPLVPLANGICQRCGQAKDQHRAKGALFYIEPEQLVAFYAEHSPANVANADAVLRKYSAQKIIEICQETYGVQPPTTRKAKGALSLSKLIFGGDTYKESSYPYKEVTPEPATLEVGMTSADFSNKHLREGDAMMIASWITHKDKGALLSLDISSNRLRVEGTKLLAKALESNQTMTSLNVSSSNMTYDGRKYGDMSGVAALADVIPGMRAISTFTFSGDLSYSEPITMETSMVEADFGGKYLCASGAKIGGKYLCASGAILVAAFLPKCT
jgi:hypothetical protein